MTKPHEEEWKTGEGALSGALYSSDTWIGSFTDPKRARLAREAPEMSKNLERLHLELECDCEHGDAIVCKIRVVLTDAGVWP